MIAILVAGGSMTAQAPMSSDQVATAKTELLTQARMGELLSRAAGCEARMLDLPTLKARVAELEAMEKKTTEMKKPSAETAAKP